VATVRVSGVVVKVDERTGVSAATADRAARPWAIRTARVLIGGGVDITPIQMGENMPLPPVGAVVDVACEYRGQYQGTPTFVVMGDWAAVSLVLPEQRDGTKDKVPA